MINNIVRIQDCALHQLSDVADLDRICFPTAHYPNFVLRQIMDLYPKLFLLAMGPEQILGYACGAVGADGTGLALSLAVRPPAQSAGIGSMLLAELLERFRTHGTRKVWLTVNPENRAALRVCKRLAFIETDHVRDYFGDKTARVILERQL